MDVVQPSAGGIMGEKGNVATAAVASVAQRAPASLAEQSLDVGISVAGDVGHSVEGAVIAAGTAAGVDTVREWLRGDEKPPAAADPPEPEALGKAGPL
jgi:hypothetical protein